MRVAFIDPCGLDFHATTVDERPLGGSQSAACYLTRALAARGHEVFLFTHLSRPGVYDGVRCCALNGAEAANPRALALDACVCVLAAQAGPQLRSALDAACPLILWQQHAHDQAAVQCLADARVRGAFDRFAFVSQWQADCYVRAFGIDAERIGIMRNAVAPAFEGLFAPGENILAAKPWPPVLAYTSTPFRGLDVLLDAMPRICAAVPGTRLRVFSSMAVYGVASGEDQRQFGALYERCGETAGVEYAGSLPQRQLAGELGAATMLAYPNTFAETSCIAVMEALAAGCMVVTSRLGALPETAAGFARLVEADVRDRAAYVEEFVAHVVDGLRQGQQDPTAGEVYLRRQMDELRRRSTWTARAEEWERWLGA